MTRTDQGTGLQFRRFEIPEGQGYNLGDYTQVPYYRGIKKALLTANGGARYTLDGTTASASNGMYLPSDVPTWVDIENGVLNVFTFVPDTLMVSLYGDPYPGVPLTFADEMAKSKPDIWYRLGEEFGTSYRNSGSVGSAADLVTSGKQVRTRSLIPDADGAARFDRNTVCYNAVSNYTLSQQPLFVEFLVRLSTLSPGGTGYLVACGGTGGWTISALNGTGQLRFTTNGVKDYDFTQTLQVGKTYHLGFFLDTSHSVTLYVNGAFSQFIPGVSPMGATTEKVRLASNGVSSVGMSGDLDEVAIFSRLVDSTELYRRYALLNLDA